MVCIVKFDSVTTWKKYFVPSLSAARVFEVKIVSTPSLAGSTKIYKVTYMNKDHISCYNLNYVALLTVWHMK